MLSLFNRQSFSVIPRQSIALFSTSSFNLLKETKKAANSTKEVKEKKSKKEKSPVKRAVGTYSYFTKDSWANHKAELANLATFADKAKRVNELWKGLTYSEKEKYAKLAEEDLQRYKKEMAEYEASLGPKKPASSYIRYALENKERVQKENPDLSFGEISKLQGKNWKALSEGERQVYKDAYHKELEHWKVEHAKFQSKA